MRLQSRRQHSFRTYSFQRLLEFYDYGIDIISRCPTQLVARGIISASLLNGSPMSRRCAFPRPEGAVEGIRILVAEQVCDFVGLRSEEHTSELQSRPHLVC